MNLLDIEKPLIEIKHRIEDLEASPDNSPDRVEKIKRLKEKEEKIAAEIYRNPDIWSRTQIARHPKRPGIMNFIAAHVDNFIELKGDRHYRDDPAIIGGFGQLGGHKIMLIGTVKGGCTKENVARNFGMAHPEGYRKAIRLMKLADRFNLPLVTLVDTPGAYPGIGAEERNQSEAIAKSIMTMTSLKIPVVSVITGEGGSGGAIALAMANSLMMMKHSFYSVISPEGCAGIIWGDGTKARDAAEALKYTAQDLKRAGIIDHIINEGKTAGHLNPAEMLQGIKNTIVSHIVMLKQNSPEKLINMRYQKYRTIGNFIK